MFKLPENCCGCGACAAACPKKCIDMKADGEGFLYPSLKERLCIDCGLCNKVCPISKPFGGDMAALAFGAVCLDDEIRMASSSGGVFSLIAEEIINNGGAVFGAAFNAELKVRHIMAEKLDALAAIRTSKYVQSVLGDCFIKAKQLLEEGRFVLFSGTACQIAGLKSFLGKDYDKLLTQDVFCLGVPSPALWEQYKKEESGGKRIVSASFRHKLPEEKSYGLRLGFDDGSSITRRGGECAYTKAFVGKYCLRESCYNCNFKGISRGIDITLADFWGADKLVPELDDGKGVSLVLIHSEKGKRAFEAIRSRLNIKQVDALSAVAENPMAIKSAYRPKNRDLFMRKYKKLGFERALYICEKLPLKARIKRILLKLTGKR